MWPIHFRVLWLKLILPPSPTQVHPHLLAHQALVCLSLHLGVYWQEVEPIVRLDMIEAHGSENREKGLVPNPASLLWSIEQLSQPADIVWTTNFKIPQAAAYRSPPQGCHWDTHGRCPQSEAQGPQVQKWLGWCRWWSSTQWEWRSPWNWSQGIHNGYLTSSRWRLWEPDWPSCGSRPGHQWTWKRGGGRLMQRGVGRDNKGEWAKVKWKKLTWTEVQWPGHQCGQKKPGGVDAVCSGWRCWQRVGTWHNGMGLHRSCE